MNFTIEQLIKTARSLEPLKGSEYERGIIELLGRTLLDHAGIGEGTGENAELIRHILHGSSQLDNQTLTV